MFNYEMKKDDVYMPKVIYMQEAASKPKIEFKYVD
jgi:hypothetical protein